MLSLVQHRKKTAHDYVHYSLEMALKVSLNVSFDNMQNWKGMQEKVEECKRTKAYITDDET
jgi:hypothetical protein